MENRDGTGTVSGARWPTFVDAAVRDLPLRADEFAIFLRIASRAGWDGGWCKKVVYDVRKFLAAAQLIEKKSGKGRRDQFRPRWPAEWVNPQQLPFIRDKIYKYRNPKKTRAASDNVEVLSLKKQEVEKRQGEQSDQLSLLSLSRLFDFTVDSSMHDWAEQECPQAAVRLGETTQKFITWMEGKVRKGYDVSRVDLREEWKHYIRKAQVYIESNLQKGNANVARTFTTGRTGENRQGAAATGGGALGGARKVPRFGRGGGS